MSGKLIPFGYLAKDADQQLEAMMRDPRAVLVDIRYNAVSRRKEWNPHGLIRLYGSRYRPLSMLGNKNYNNDGPIEIADPKLGIPLLVEGLTKGYDLILMCACKDYATCHRKAVVDLVKAQLPQVEIVGIPVRRQMASRTRKLTYPENWAPMASAAKEKAGWKCEWCGIAQGTECIGLKGRPYKIMLTVHHPNGDTENPDALLVALCQTCHLKDDAQMHAEHAKSTRFRKLREAALDAGQLSWCE